MASGPPKQRGIYSQILTTQNTQALKYASTVGPQAGNVIHKNTIQKMPRAVALSHSKQNGKAVLNDGALSEAASGKQMARSYFKEPNVQKKREGVAVVDPKVMEPYVPIPGRPPRKVVIDRLKKQYSSFDIEDLLKQLNVDFRNPKKCTEGWLPLEPFDDEEFDCRTKDDWIQQGKDIETGKQLPIPAKALWQDQDGQHYWRRVLIRSYNPITDQFQGVWDGTKETCKLTRINVLFDAQDPRIFAKRVADAYEKRRYADSLIRYNYFIDNMPTHQIPELDAQQIGRIREMVQNNKNLRKQIDLNPKISEVNLDFARTMNKIIFDKHMEQKNGDLIAGDLHLPPKEPPPPVPHFAMVSIPPHDFPEQFSNFCFNTLYVKEEVIRAMVDIRAECNEVLNQDIYNTKLKTMRLEDFKQIQSGSISQRAYYLKETWVNRLKQIIKSYFSGVGKGWFNLNETSKETYEFGKLKKFLTVVKFQMQDTLLFLTKRSVKCFVEALLSFIPFQTHVKDAKNVQNKFKPKKEGKYTAQNVLDDDVQEIFKEPPPLFLIDLFLKPGAQLPQYNMDPQDIVLAIQTIFDNGIKALQEIPQLQPKILPHLFKTQAKSYLKAAIRPPEKPAPPDPKQKNALPDENTWVWDAYDTISKHLNASIQPLNEYTQTYAKFQSVNALNPEEYVASLDEDDNPMEEVDIKADIYKHMEEEKSLLDQIPEQAVVSIFEINCKEIRSTLAGKHSEIAKLEIELIGARARNKNAELSNKFREIDNKIRHAPKDIQELHETKEYMANAPNDINKLKIQINQVMDIYGILDQFNFKLTSDDIKKKYELYGSPKDTYQLIDRQTQYLEKEKQKFLQQMIGNQDDFLEELNDLQNLVSTFAQYQDMNQHEDIANIVRSVNTRMKKAQDDARLFNSREVLIGIDQTDYSQLNQMTKEFSYFSNLWLQTDNWFKSHESWLNDPWDQLDAPKLEDTVENCNKIMTQVMRYFRDKELPQILAIADTMKKKVEEFQPFVPVAVSLRKEGMKDRHWEQITQKTGIVVKPDDDFTLQKVIDLGLVEHTDVCVDVGERAEKEYNIECSLKKMYLEWESIEFRLPQFKKTTTSFVVGFDDAMAILDEHSVMTQAMQFSNFKKPFEEEIDEWDKKLMLVSDTIEEWIKCQQQWMYLQPIFDSPDIMRQLPAETKRFKSVDSTWRHIINNTKSVPNVLKTCSKQGLLEKFQQANKNLELVTKGLYDYLETKRSIFARFYFLSNDELLEILSQTKEVENVRPHLKKVFENMADLTFMPDKKITEMFSAEGEKVGFVKPIDPVDKGVEFWMGDVERMMQTSVRDVLLNSIEDYKVTPRTEWVFRHPGQCVLNGSQVHWTLQVQDSLNRAGNQGVKEYMDFCNKQLLDTVKLVRQRLTKLQTISLNALIVIDVHAKDVVEKLWRAQVEDIHAFEWIMQLRYYWENEDCRVKCVQTDFPYGYEYLGNTMRLVITPLTDKCYMTLMGALKLNLGGNPAGPAGTGKTESTKDLAKALAKQCVVFNCSDGMDYKMVGKFFKGLASAGAWACFDEFNRINIEVLSVIAQQLHTLFGAKSTGDTEIQFEESQIKIKPTFSVFVTMNPGYAGRTELPDNLKAHFRPVAMMVPDYALIAEIMLYSFGFTIARDLARKMVATFKLSSEQLSSQDHYDYGMRAVRSVINAAGLLKSADPDMDESQLLLRALRDVNVPKFLKDDLPLFENIISDLFPTTKRPQIDYGNLNQKLIEAHQFYNYQSEEVFTVKNIQLYDTIQVRHGLMIVGPTGAAKTASYRSLAKAYNLLKDEQNFSKVFCHVLNPKSITMGQLYGMTDPQTSEWMDGVLARIIQECARDLSPDRHWVMFDGPVDALWIQNMNTVLDDNKKLCLNSGQIITLTERMTMMFEVEDLAVASPATVSRCGMVYMEPDSLGLQPLLKSWYNTQPPAFKLRKTTIPMLQKFIDSYLFQTIDFCKRNCKEPVVTPYNNVICSFFKLMDCYFADYYETEIKKVTAAQIEDLELQLESLGLFSLVWSCGAPLDAPGRITFNQYFRQATKDSKIPFPQEGTIYDYCFDRSQKSWKKWLETIPEFKVDNKLSFAEIIVPTNDSVRNRHILKLLILHDKHIMNPGPTGTGKTVNVIGLMQSDMPQEYQVISITFSAQTSANQTQDMLDSKFEKRRKGVFGPTPGKKFVVFVDDLNMPKKQVYGAQPPIEILRQWMDHKGWYDRKTKQKPFQKIEDIIFVTAMGPPSGGRQHITNRITRHFNVIAYTDLQDSAIKKIFFTILQSFVSRFAEPIKLMVDELTNSQLRVFSNVHKTLLPMPGKSHYLFNMRDFAKVFQGLCSAYSKTTLITQDMLRLWVHENTRVFGDRLISNEDKTLLKSLLDAQITSTFKIKLEDVYTSQRIIFGDFMNGIDVDPRFYQPIPDMEEFLHKIEDYLQEYNDTVRNPMKLVMFLDACEHVSRISRVLRQPQGHALLLGVGGSGRQSLSRLGSFIANYKISQIEVIKGYNMTNWREDIKKVLMTAGVENKPLTFLFVDTQIINEQMLEDINNVLNSGDVPNLYKNEDFDAIYTATKQDCIRKGLSPTKMNMFNSYLLRIKQNIHLIIAMSPLGEIFTTRLRMFPSLVNCCTIDWFTEWPAEALLGVARGSIIDADLKLGDHQESCVQIFKTMHQSVEVVSKQYLQELRRSNYVTPTSYLELLNLYKRILTEQRNYVQQQKTRLEKGLKVLAEAQTQVAKLQTELDSKQPILEKTKKQVQETKKVLQVEYQDAEKEKKIVAQDESLATQQANEIEVLKKNADADLAQAIPALESATKALQKLKVDDFYEMRAAAKPTKTVVNVFEIVCVMMNVQPIKSKDPKKLEYDPNGYWQAAKLNLLKDPKNLLKQLVKYDKDHIPDKTIQKIKPRAQSEQFSQEKVSAASQALVAVRLWVLAMIKYHEILKIVEPKREQVKQMNIKLEAAMKFLNEKRAKLQEVEERIEELERKYKEKIELENSLTQQIEDCNKKLERAAKLINGLEGENNRWTETVKTLAHRFSLLIGDCLIAAGMVSYAGAFVSSYRSNLEEMWNKQISNHKIEHTNDVTMRNVLGDDVMIRIWNVAGLPNDNLSIENGIIMFKSRRWPLMIDPQNQANKFVKNLGRDQQEQGIDVFKQSDGNMLKMLELAIQFGKWVLIENVGEQLDPALEPILLQQKQKSGSSYVIRLGDKTIPYSDNFKFFMTTTLPNPHYSPETSVKVTILNFAITPQGLEEQMLNQLVQQEMPELQEKKNFIVTQNAKAAKDLRDIQEKILQSLTKNDDIAMILEEDQLINILATSKKTAEEINQRVAESKIMEKEIDQTRQSFRPVAFRASLLFFCINDLSLIDPMYQYSLQWFAKLFSAAIDNSAPSNVVDQRILSVNNTFTYSLYQNVCRSLFEVHKLLFSFLLTTKILFGDDKINLAQWRFFLAGPSGETDSLDNPLDWLGDMQWKQLYKNLWTMSQLPVFKSFDKYFIENHRKFKKIFDSNDPHTQPIPGEWSTRLNSFQKMIILKAIRPDKMSKAIQNYVSEHMGTDYIKPPPFSIAQSFKDSSVTTPLIFVLSSGTDPVADFMKFSEEMSMTKSMNTISLGQGQDKKAEKMIDEGSQRGGWVLLQNCHLAISWMPKLEVIVENLNDSNHRDFRLWLTSMPCPQFPVSTLQNSVKMTLEPPKGLRFNLERTFINIDNKELNDCTKPQIYKKLVFSFAFFHAIIQDRRKFGPIGWNIAYQFTNEDLMVCRKQLKLFLDEYEEVPFKVLNYLGAQINYGGRVTDDKDERLIETILRKYVCPDALISGYKFSISGKYYIPQAEDQQDFLAYIRQLPIDPQPQAFGMHQNAEITTNQDQTRRTLEAILSIQPRSSSSGGKTREQVIMDLSKFIEEKTPKPFVLEDVQKLFPILYEQSMNTVLIQQVIRYNKLLKCMWSTLQLLQKALKGFFVMSQELELMANSLFDNQVPTKWADVGFLSLKPLASWVEDLNKRITFLTDWIDRGSSPLTFWISGFFFPQAFLTGTLQNFARKHVIAIDRLSFDNIIYDQVSYKDIKQPLEDGVYVYGLYLEGARWNDQKHILDDSKPKELYSEMPMIWYLPKKDRETPTSIYNCPVYKVLSRAGTLSTTGHSTNFVLFMQLPSKEAQSQWTKAGVAAFLALRY